jgi:hypothetical protein
MRNGQGMHNPNHRAPIVTPKVLSRSEREKVMSAV